MVFSYYKESLVQTFVCGFATLILFLSVCSPFLTPQLFSVSGANSAGRSLQNDIEAEANTLRPKLTLQLNAAVSAQLLSLNQNPQNPKFDSAEVFDFLAEHNNHSINYILIGASHGGSDALQNYLAKKHPIGSNSKSHFYGVMLEPSNLAFGDLDEWTKNNNAMYGNGSLHLLNAAFSINGNGNETLRFFNWNDKFLSEFPNEPGYILYQQGSYKMEHMQTILAERKKMEYAKTAAYISPYYVQALSLDFIVDEYFLKNGLREIHMVFIDAQGFEYEITKALLTDEDFVTNVFNFEPDMRQEEREELLAMAEQKGYKCFCPSDCFCIKI